MIKKFALAAIIVGFSAGIAHGPPASAVAGAHPTQVDTALNSDADWGVNRLTVGFKKRGFRRGGFGIRRGFRSRRHFRGHRAYRGSRFSVPRSYRSYGYGHRGFFSGSRVRGTGTVR